MPNPAYPSIPVSFEVPRGPEFRTIRSRMEAGYAVSRPAWTTATGLLVFQLHHLVELADHDTLETFFMARKSSDPIFDLTDPKTSTVVPCEFLDDRWPAVWLTPNLWEIVLDVQQVLA